MGPACTGLKYSSSALDKLHYYMQMIKAHIFLPAGEMVCLLKIWLAQETQSLFDFLRLVLNILLHYQLPADLWCIAEVLMVTLACSALFQTRKFAVLEPNAILSACFVQAQAAAGQWPVAAHKNYSFSLL